ncbi:hypothetical protein Tco_1556510 [Tanacetum coccineum]
MSNKRKRAQVQFEVINTQLKMRILLEQRLKLMQSCSKRVLENTKRLSEKIGEELQTKTSKRLKSDEAKEDESTKKTGKRRKQISRKGLHSDKADEDGSEDTMLKDITRDDLTELYRIVVNRYGVNGPEDELEKVLWGYLKNMFEEPLSTDPIWSLLGQQGS